VRRSWEDGHVRAGLSDDHVRNGLRDPRDRHQQIPCPRERGGHGLDPRGERLDRALLGVQQRQVLRHHERVVLGEPALQCLDQRRNLVAQGAFGQVGEHLGVTFPGDQRLQHRSRRYPGSDRWPPLTA
jgi:hypothetical protein